MPGDTWNGKIIDATYDYRDADGRLIFQNVRMAPKEFWLRRPDGNGGWIGNLKDVPRPLPIHGLPEVLQADPAAYVYVPEGEKAVGYLRSRGLVATTNAMGAEKAKFFDWTPLRGRHVVVLPDNDELMAYTNGI